VIVISLSVAVIVVFQDLVSRFVIVVAVLLGIVILDEADIEAKSHQFVGLFLRAIL
jgi:hypothetical protein